MDSDSLSDQSFMTCESECSWPKRKRDTPELEEEEEDEEWDIECASNQSGKKPKTSPIKNGRNRKRDVSPDAPEVRRDQWEKLAKIYPATASCSKSPGNDGIPSTLFACTLNTPEISVKGIHVDMQRRYFIEQRLSKITTKGQTVVSYKIKSAVTGEERKLTLKNMWSEIDWMAPGTLVNVVGVEVDENNCFVVEREQGYLIVEPDRLVSSTSIVSQLFCERKAALVSRFYMAAGDNVHIFRGVLAHELICRAMQKNTDDTEIITRICRHLCQKPEMLEKAYGIGMTDEDLKKMQQDVAQWVERFMKKRYLKKSNLDPKHQSFKFVQLVGVEDNIWNPTFGLKGKIDATVLIKKDSSDTAMVVPLEFKTGSTKSQKKQGMKADHVGQVALYTLMMGIKFGSIEDAILYYISDDTLSLHPARMIELQQLIMLRNKYIRHTGLSGGELPNLPRPSGIEFDFQCKNCEIRNVCTLQLRKQNIPQERRTRTENLLLDSNPLSNEELAFLDEWLQIINAETEEVEKKFNEKWLWTKTPGEREKAGCCVTDLRMCEEIRTFKTNGRTKFLVSFVKKSEEYSQHEIPLPFHVDDFVVLSSNVEVCINHGLVVMIRGNEITLMLEQPLHPTYLHSGFTYCIDKLSTSSPIASQYGYLVKLMEDSENAARLREYIIMKKQPKFEKIQVPNQQILKIMEDLNGEQKRVITKSLTTDSFLFVKGSPGSGKTTAIVCLLRALVTTGKTVLVATYTGTALENILRKYMKYDKNFIKISANGNAEKELTDCTTKSLCASVKTIAGLKKVYNKPIVGTTLLSLKHPIFQVRRFDYCIVDEASQALPTAVLGALSISNKYIVFGDPNQLPPILQSTLVKSRNISDNFFSLMATTISTVKLNIQYRMNRGIMALANQLMYDNQMKCASDEQERGYIKLKEEDIRSYLQQKVTSIPARRMMCHTVSKKLQKTVVFLDTSDVSAFETRVDESVSNVSKKDITVACVRLFVESKLNPNSLGIIAPYQGQVNLIRSSLKKLKDEKYHDIEVNTVDQYQGREMEVIICSFTKSLPKNTGPPTGEKVKFDQAKEGILEDMRRLNVAVTRARNKLVLIGNRVTLERFSPFKKLFEIIQPEQMYKLCSEEVEGLKQAAEWRGPPHRQVFCRGTK